MPDAPGFNGENDIRALMLCCELTHSCIKHSCSEKSAQSNGPQSVAFPHAGVPLSDGGLEKQDTVRCQGTDHRLRHRRQIYRISVSLSGFKAQTYGCRKNLLLLFSTAAKTKAKVKAYDTMISY